MAFGTTQSRSRWKLWGIATTVSYALLFLFLIGGTWPEIVDLELNELGDFFAGLFAPLALLWLVLGFFQQGEELRLQAEELRASVEQASAQAEALKVSAQHTKYQAISIMNDSFASRVADSVELLLKFMSRKSTVSRERQGFSFQPGDIASIRRRFSEGDQDAFFEDLWRIVGILDERTGFVEYFAQHPKSAEIVSASNAVCEEFDDWVAALEQVGGKPSDMGRSNTVERQQFQKFRDRVVAAAPH